MKPNVRQQSKKKTQKPSALEYVKRYLAQLPKSYIFTTRELLPLVKRRSTLDVYLSAEVKEDRLERLARGVFRKSSFKNKPVTEERIAAIKRMAFAGKLATTPNSRIEREVENSLFESGYPDFSIRRTLFHTTNSDCGFQAYQFINGSKDLGYGIRLAEIAISPIGNRKMALGETNAGRQMRQLWLRGEDRCGIEDILEVWANLTNAEKMEVTALKKFMPQWLSDHLPEAPKEALLILSDSLRLKRDGKDRQYKKPGRRILR